MAQIIKPGFYSAKAVAGSEQYGKARNGSPQVGVDLDLFNGRDVVGQMTTVLSFGGAAGPFAIERLRALGWEGTDILRLDGIDRNVVQAQVFEEVFEGKARLKCEIRTTSTIRFETQMGDDERESFAADVLDLMTKPPQGRR